MTATTATGPAAAVILDVVPAGVRATAVSMFALVQNLMGLAVGPVVTVPDTPARCGGSRPTPPRGAGGVQRGERLVRTHGLQGAHLRRGLEGRLGAAEPHASRRPDLMEGGFPVRTANRLSAADLTRIHDREGMLRLAGVRMC